MVKASTCRTLTIIKVLDDDPFKIIELAIRDENSRKAFFSLFFIIEKLDPLRFICQTFKGQFDIIKAFKLNAKAYTVLDAKCRLFFFCVLRNRAELLELFAQSIAMQGTVTNRERWRPYWNPMGRERLWG